jgi:prepilin peptidase CpaA
MSTVIYAGIFATAALSCAWDVRRRRIPNALTFGSAALACCVYLTTAGFSGVAFSAAGWATGLLLFLPWFLAGGMGGGDVKLLAAFGAWLGPAQTGKACLFAMLAGGVCALFVVVRDGRLKAALASTLRLAVQPGGPLEPVSPSGTGQPRSSIAYAVPVAAGVGLALWLR